MDDGIIYHLDNSKQFWEELDDILSQENNKNSLFYIDIFVKFLTKFQDEYLKSEMEFMDCCYKLLVSPVYQSFPDKVIEHFIQRAVKKTDVKELRVLYSVLFLAGKENIKKENKNKQIFIRVERDFVSKLKNHICEGDRLQQISIQLLFEICSIQRLLDSELNLIDEYLLNYLFDLVEKTRDDEDETFNYSVIYLILSFNEQFMLAVPCESDELKEVNTVLRVLGTRIGNSKTFSENVIFMLNRAVDEHTQMIILKLLFVIFTTRETYEYFYTNDLRVLIDVFIRELYDLPEESEMLRQIYLRVLLPLIKNTQLCQYRYKQHQIYSLLLDLIGSSTNQFKPISPLTRKLANRCLTETDYFDGIAPPRNCGNRIERTATPNAIVTGNTNGNGFTVGDILVVSDPFRA